MTIIGALPFTLQNDTTADATQVMADLNLIKNDVNANAAQNGANSSITSLTGLTTPLSVAQGGTGQNVGGVAIATALHLGFGLGYLYGLTLSNNGADAVNDIDIAAGYAGENSGGVIMQLASAYTKRLDASWAVGTNQGMRASGGAIADTTYHIFLIRRSDSGVVDVAADTSVTGANIAANTNVAYTQKRRIGSILRSGGAILAFAQDGDKFLLKTTINDINSVAAGAAAVTRTLSVPLGVVVDALIIANDTNNGAISPDVLFLSSLDTTDEVPALSNVQIAYVKTAAGFSFSSSWAGSIKTNTSAQIRSRQGLGDANCGILISTRGWIDNRGRLA